MKKNICLPAIFLCLSHVLFANTSVSLNVTGIARTSMLTDVEESEPPKIKEGEPPEAISALHGVTFGFGAGYSNLFTDLYDYSLTTDAKPSLQRQLLSRSSFVISSVIIVKLARLAVEKKTSRFLKFDRNGETEELTGLQKFFNKLSINAALDLINVKSNDVSFNKSISGGLGVGYFLTENVQLALFYDRQNYRQLRDYITDNYLGKEIPKGATTYNALNTSDDALFYNKTISGFSFKVTFSLANRKSD
jgi:hypothetical protein